MPIPDVAERWSSKVNEVTIGATAADGGTRTSVVTLGGAQAVPFMDFEGAIGQRPVVAMDILDAAPEDWPAALAQAHQDVWDNPGAWAKKCVDEYGAEMICLKLDGTHPDKGDRSGDDAAATVKAVLEAVGVPLIVWGSGDDAKDNEVMPKVSAAAKGERCLLGKVTEDNYKTLTAVALADGHNIISQAPLDINIAKQVNILVSEMDFPLERVVMFQTTGALGYGLEYSYSIQERERLAALTGDKMMAMPMICDCGAEAWKSKEARSTDDDVPEWGPQGVRGPMWEVLTAAALLQSGVDICRVRHPKTAEIIKAQVADLAS